MSTAEDLTCRELVELVTDYLEGALPRKERARFEEHLDMCDGCSTYVDRIRRTIALTGALTEETLDPKVRDELLAAFRGWKARRA